MADALVHLQRELAAPDHSRRAISFMARNLSLGPVPVGEAIRRCEKAGLP